MSQLAVNCALGAWAAAVTGVDLYLRRVPNLLLALLLLPALAWLAWRGQGLLGASTLQSLIGALLALLVLLPGHMLGYMGAGDVKLGGVLGLLLGPASTIEMLLIGAALLGLASGAILIHRGGMLAEAQRARMPAAPAFAAAFALQLSVGRLLT